MSLNILIAAGGTGGHVYPAIAIADAIRKARPPTSCSRERAPIWNGPPSPRPATGSPKSG